MENKKAQAAVEFLTTYGWVVLLLIIIISFTFYSGYLDMNRYLQKQCLFSPNFQCSSYKLDKANSTTMRLTLQAGNGLGYSIYFANNSALLITDNLGKAGKANYSGRCYPDLVKPGELATCIINITDVGSFPSADKNFNLLVRLNYTNCNTAPKYAQTGNCTGGSVHELSGSVRTSFEQNVSLFQYCGDGNCNRTILETYATCPTDCPPVCGDGMCQPPETYLTCSKDCCEWDCTNKTSDICHSECYPAGCGLFYQPCNNQQLNARRCSNMYGNPGNTHYVTCCRGSITPCTGCVQTTETTVTCTAMCGNGNCETGEDYTNCCPDCHCPGSQFCCDCDGFFECVSSPKICNIICAG
jgi:hypothetical protein